MIDNFGDRMKDYEARETERRFIPLLPIYARIDGRCFSKFTHGLARPYDLRITRAMIDTTKFLIADTHARIGYAQSDEISLIWLQEDSNAEMLFGGKVHKLVSVLASMASARFATLCRQLGGDIAERAEKLSPHFDCRVFQFPNRIEGANVFLWREQDATKNAISMAARSFYSHKALDGKRGSEMQEMIFQKGQNFNDYPAFFKRGTFVRRVVVERKLSEFELTKIPEKHRPAPDTVVTRSEIVELDMPPFGKVLNREAVIFDGAKPITEEKHMTAHDPDLFEHWRRKKRIERFGKTFSATLDGERIGTLMSRVFAIMMRGEWTTLQDLAREAGGSEASVSARLREVKQWCEETDRGEYERRRKPGFEKSGIHEYRVVLKRPQ